MLQLRAHKYANTYSNQYYYGQVPDRLTFGDNSIRVQNHQYYFRGPNSIVHADLPLHMNNIEFIRSYFTYDEDRTERDFDIIDNIKTGLLDLFNSYNNNDYYVITGYLAGETLSNKDYEYEFIDGDLWKEFKEDNIIALFNKCVEQTSLRESERQNRTIQQHIRVFKSKAKHIILMLTDYADGDQESETFLALGLAPVLFEDFKPKLSSEEIDYLKCLVNRSQVKRISNVKPAELFNVLLQLEKYKKIERDIRYKTMFTMVAEARVKVIERQSRDFRNQADQALTMYDTALKKLGELEILIDKYREGTDAAIEELNTISKMKYVYDLDMDPYNNSTLKIILRVPIDYFDIDEAECAVKNYRDETVKKFITDIFVEQKLKLIARVDTAYVYTTDASFRDFPSLDAEDCRLTNALFNPHYQFYHCLGDYKPQLIKAMRDQDLTMFVNIALAAARSINFRDGAVCNKFFEWLESALHSDYYLKFKCLEDKNGNLYSLEQWLNNNYTNEPEENINVVEPRDIV